MDATFCYQRACLAIILWRHCFPRFAKEALGSTSLCSQSVLSISMHLSAELVLQVSWSNLEPGLVVITVAAFRIAPPPYSPQLFSLAVQGSFTGELQSTYNPGWSGATSTVCTLPVAQITSAPPLLSNQLTPQLVFNTAVESDAATAGFECKLSGTAGSTAASAGSPLQDWTACTSPTSFAFTSPGTAMYTYLFQVRAKSASFTWASIH